MSLSEQGGLSAADIAAVTNGNNGFGFGGGDFGYWILVLIILAVMGNGFGFGGNGNVGADVQRGFDQSAVISGINGINTSLNNLGLNQSQQMNTIAMSQQQAMCENRAALADIKYTIANEASATRAADQQNKQAIMDKLCQLELDGVKQNYEAQIRSLQDQLNAARGQIQTAAFNASQNAQTAAVLADNAAQTVAVEQYLNPTPRPAYVVPNPNCCTPFNNGCTCGVMG